MTSDIGHRGAVGLEPEKHLALLLTGCRRGGDAVELDLRLTRDGRLVVLYAPTVNRTTNGNGPGAGMTLDEIQRLDAGLGEWIPTLEETLDAVELPIYAELKAVEAAGPLADLILARGLAGRVTPISFQAEALRRIKLSLPDLPVGLIVSGAA